MWSILKGADIDPALAATGHAGGISCAGKSAAFSPPIFLCRYAAAPGLSVLFVVEQPAYTGTGTRMNAIAER